MSKPQTVTIVQTIAWILGIIGGGLLLAITVFWFWFSTASDTTSHLHDWPAFYETDVSNVFKLPKEAQIIRADDHSGFPMGREVLIQFRLPEQREPAAWVKHIANSSGIGDQYRVSPLEYDGPGDYNLVSYDAEKRQYEVLYGWD